MLDAAVWVPASKKRRALAFYVDLMIFGAACQLLEYALRLFIPAFRELPLWGQLAALTVIEYFMPVRWSPGVFLLGMREERESVLVDSRISSRETWLTVLLGIVFINDGGKAMTRWTQWTPPVPVFGSPSTEAASAVLYLALGGAEIWLASGILQLRSSATRLLVCLQGVMLASMVKSWDLWDAWGVEYVLRRNKFHGRVTGPETLDSVKMMMPEFLVCGMLVLLAMTAIAHRQLRRLEKDAAGKLAN